VLYVAVAVLSTTLSEWALFSSVICKISQEDNKADNKDKIDAFRQ